MNILKTILLTAMVLASVPSIAQRQLGGDISLLPSYEDAGTQFRTSDGTAMEPLKLFRDVAGWNSARVRIFVDPSKASEESKSEGVCQDFPYVARLCREIKKAGMSLMLDFHYSDTWADPSHQTIPSRWQGLSSEAMADSIYAYTKNTLIELKACGIVPDMIQVGNEITNGMLWPVGKIDPSTDDKNWPTLASFIGKGVKACREIYPKARLIIHTEKAGEWPITKKYYQMLERFGIDYDTIGLSYYPMWHKSVRELDATLDSIATTFPQKEIMIVEVAFYYSHDNDKWSTDGQYSDLYPISPDGQAQFTRELVEMLRRHERVTGLYWWFPEENESGRKVIGSWINRGLFDNHTGRALPALYELRQYIR